MKIKSISVGGYKNLCNVKLELEQICAIISPNNYGKSNLLEAIDFGIDFMHASRKIRKNMMGWIKGIPLCPALENEEYRFEVEFDDDSLGEYRFVRYGFSFRWHRDDSTGDRITNEWIETRENESVRYTTYLKRNEEKYRKGKATAAFRKIELDNLQLAIDILALLEEIEIADVVKSIQSIMYRICSSLDLREGFQPSPLEYIEDDEDVVRFDDTDVPKALSRLKNNAPDKYRLFEEAVFTLFPEFTDIYLKEFALSEQSMKITVTGTDLPHEELEKDIPFRLREHIYRLLIKSDFLNQSMSMVNMSTGTKRVIWLLANAFIFDYVGTGIIGIEEIETSIHPKMICKLLELLTEAVGEAPLILSSHSPYLLQYLKLEMIYIGVPNSKGVAEFKKIQKNKLKTIISNARDRELTVGEYLFELLSGDSDAYTVLRGFLEETRD